MKYGIRMFAEDIMVAGSDIWGRDTGIRCTTITIIVAVINKHEGTRDNGYIYICIDRVKVAIARDYVP